jgi:hypothetical protein
MGGICRVGRWDEWVGYAGWGGGMHKCGGYLGQPAHWRWQAWGSKQWPEPHSGLLARTGGISG